MARDHRHATLLCMDAYDAVDVEIGHVVPVRSPMHDGAPCSTYGQATGCGAHLLEIGC
jgi:hypothetical protein